MASGYFREVVNQTNSHVRPDWSKTDIVSKRKGRVQFLIEPKRML